MQKTWQIPVVRSVFSTKATPSEDRDSVISISYSGGSNRKKYDAETNTVHIQYIIYIIYYIHILTTYTHLNFISLSIIEVPSELYLNLCHHHLLAEGVHHLVLEAH